MRRRAASIVPTLLLAVGDPPAQLSFGALELTVETGGRRRRQTLATSGAVCVGRQDPGACP